MQSLIYDVGVWNGDDTAYYLSQAQRVVSIEANPVLAKAAETRFAAEIQAGRLTVINKGIAPQAGILDFWINQDMTEWSSFSRETAGREGHRLERVPVETITLPEILTVHGVPDYLKIDIESYDRVCIESLSEARKPRYVSIEFNEIEMLDLLEARGYNRFKCICQFTQRDLSMRLVPFFTYFEMLYNLAAKKDRVAHAAKARCTEQTLWDLVKDLQSILGSGFPPGSSGPFGEETDGPWRTKDEIAELYRTVRSRVEQHHSVVPIWCDVHATTV